MEENGYSDANITILLGVASKTLLKKINEDLFLRNKNESNEKLKENVNVNVNNINFKYILTNDI